MSMLVHLFGNPSQLAGHSIQCSSFENIKTIRHGPYLPWINLGVVMSFLGMQDTKVIPDLGLSLLGCM